MRNALARTNLEVLQQLAWSNALLAFDFDGTLAPIVADPDRAGMRARTRDLLEELTALYPVCVISGRAQRDVRARLDGICVREVVGNHGLEPWHASDSFVAEVQRWLPILAEELATHRGVVVEDKSFSVAIHYRASRAKKEAQAAIARATERLGRVRVVGGKQVVNVLPHDAPHKGIALERVRAKLRCDTALFVGDDETDEDVFTLDQPGQLLSIRVGERGDSAADFCIDDQRSIDALLQVLIDLRHKAGETRERASTR
jgi:trehalose 6-phosphate phosphatase